jgi:hypothetical protein
MLDTNGEAYLGKPQIVLYFVKCYWPDGSYFRISYPTLFMPWALCRKVVDDYEKYKYIFQSCLNAAQLATYAGNLRVLEKNLATTRRTLSLKMFVGKSKVEARKVK